MWDFHVKCDSSLCLTAIEWGKEKKQFVDIRFVQLAFLRKMLGTTKRNGIFLQLNHNVAHCNSPK